MATLGSKPRSIAPDYGWYTEAFDRFMDNADPWLQVFWPVIAAYFALGIFAVITCSTGAIAAILIPGMMCATARGLLVVARGGVPPDVGTLWRWTLELFWVSIIFAFVLGFVVALSVWCCVLPLFFLMIPYYLGFIALADGRGDFWGVFVEFCEACWPHVWEWMLFGLVATLLSAFIITMPFIAIAFVIAYERMHAAEMLPEAVGV